MNVPRFIMAVIGVFFAIGVVQIIFQGFIISAQVDAVHTAFNLRAEPHWSGWLGQITMTILFCYIFLQGYEGKGVGEGVRFGLLMGLFSTGSSIELYGLVDAPLSAAYVVMAVDLLAWVVAGAALALIYKPKEGGQDAAA